jgi:hypothetical protein
MTKRLMLGISLALVLVGMSAGAAADGPQPWCQRYEAYLNYVEQMPIDAETSYSQECQGIAHDSGNWFVSQNVGPIPFLSPVLWKIPKGLNLADTFDCGEFGVECAYTRLTPSELSQYDHVGDIDHYQYNPTTGFVLLSLENSEKAVPPAIAVYDPVDLGYIAHAELGRPPGLPQPKNCPWVAVNPADGVVYTTHDDAEGKAWKYEVNWGDLADERVMTLQYTGTLEFLDENGTPFDVGGQGGAFSESGELFYSTNGGVDTNYERDGIHVFDMETRRRIARSPATGEDPKWYFWFPWDWGECEPEGLTVWDLDEDQESSHSGQLHVLLLNNDIATDDNIYVFHYTSKIYVDKENPIAGCGKPDDPFNTVGAAFALAWPGSRISIKAGTYSEPLTFPEKVQVFATEGTATLGMNGRIALSPSGVVNLAGNGTLRLH